MIRVDDLGTPVEVKASARRVVSLVPSLTESIASVDRGALVGATDWCTYPPDLDVRRVRGTKNPDVAAIQALAPDVVIANKEENRRRDVERLRAAGVSVWVTVIETVDHALSSLGRLFDEALGWPRPGWLEVAEAQWAGAVPERTLRAVIPVWRDPWMVVGSSTFTGDLAARLGLLNTFGDSADRYPRTTPGAIAATGPDVVVLPDEPYFFNAFDGPEVFPGIPAALVSGRLLTWYGPSLATARAELSQTLTGLFG